MHYFSIPGHVHHDKGIILRHGTIAKPRPAVIRVKDLKKGDQFKMRRHRYKVVAMTDIKITYCPYVYNLKRKRSTLDRDLKFTFGRHSQMRVGLTL